jgi:hypothetical protein
VALVAGGSPLEVAAPFQFVLKRFAPVHEVWLSFIDPGGFIVPHRDAGPYRERWQVPIIAAGCLSGVDAADGVPFPVRHWERHFVRNDTEHPRVHIVIDRDVVLDVPSLPFEVFPRQGDANG